MATPVAEELMETAEAAGGPVTDQMATWLAVRYIMAAAQKRENSRWRSRIRLAPPSRVLLRSLGAPAADRPRRNGLQIEREKMGFTSPR